MKKTEDDWLAWRLRDQAKFNSCNQLYHRTFLIHFLLRSHFSKWQSSLLLSPVIYPSIIGRIVEWLKVNHMKWHNKTRVVRPVAPIPRDYFQNFQLFCGIRPVIFSKRYLRLIRKKREIYISYYHARCL
jgi:hypothetical protein